VHPQQRVYTELVKLCVNSELVTLSVNTELAFTQSSVYTELFTRFTLCFHSIYTLFTLFILCLHRPLCTLRSSV
jgi:hypothetical protein